MSFKKICCSLSISVEPILDSHSDLFSVTIATSSSPFTLRLKNIIMASCIVSDVNLLISFGHVIVILMNLSRILNTGFKSVPSHQTSIILNIKYTDLS